MEYGIALTPHIPMRSEPSECAEMTSEILFGEHFRILRREPRWLFVENCFDGYQGWIDWKMSTPLSLQCAQTLGQGGNRWIVRHPLADIRKRGDKSPIRVSIGTVLPGYDPVRSEFRVEDAVFSIPRRSVAEIVPSHIRALIRTAELYMHTSYVWGGRTIFGVDCSGFTQVVYRINGINLPRNASQQIACGEPVASFGDAYPGDLAFFANDKGKITHVGIVYTPDSIIHCSGNVHIDKLTPDGIWSDRLGGYTHSAPILRRFADLRKRK